MNTIRLINLINSVTSGSIGVIVCFILMYLILKKTAQEMKQYSQILLQSTLLDLFLANTSIFVDIILSVKNGRFYLIAGEFFRNSPLTVRFIVTIIWTFSIVLLSNFLAVLFMYRYAMLTKHGQLDYKTYLKILAFPVLSEVFHIILVIILLSPNEVDLQLANDDLGVLLGGDGENLGLGYVLKITEAKTLIVLCALVPMFCVTYFIVVSCVIKIIRYMKSTSQLVDIKTREAQKQLTFILIYQTITPIVTIFIPFLILVIPLIFQIDASILSIFSTSFVPWVPAINGITTMWIIKPYRRAIKSVFIKNSGNSVVNRIQVVVVSKSGSQASVAPTPVS